MKQSRGVQKMCKQALYCLHKGSLEEAGRQLAAAGGGQGSGCETGNAAGCIVSLLLCRGATISFGL